MKRVSLAAIVMMFTAGVIAALATTASASCMAFEDQQSLVNCGVIATATGNRRVRVQTDCDQNLEIDILNVPKGFYSVWVDGVNRGTIHAKAQLGGQIEFDTSPMAGQLLLNFNPFGHIDIAQAGRVILSLGQCPTQ